MTEYRVRHYGTRYWDYRMASSPEEAAMDYAEKNCLIIGDIIRVSTYGIYKVVNIILGIKYCLEKI